MNMERKRLLILGSGGYGRVVEDIASQLGRYDKILFLDDAGGEEVCGACSDYPDYIDDCTEIYPAFGNNELRKQWLEKLTEVGAEIPLLIHPTAYVSPTAQVKRGTIVLPKAVVNSYTVVEQGCILNIGCIIDHNCVIGAGVHVCPGVVIKADNHIPECLKIESGTVIQNRTYRESREDGKSD